MFFKKNNNESKGLRFVLGSLTFLYKQLLAPAAAAVVSESKMLPPSHKVL